MKNQLDFIKKIILSFSNSHLLNFKNLVNVNTSIVLVAPLLIFILFTFGSCSTFHEEDILPRQNEFLKIETPLPIIQISVEEEAFSKMLAQPTVEIEIEGEFNLFRNKILVVEKEQVEIEIKGGFSTKFPLKTLGIKFEDKYDNSDRSLINPAQTLPIHNLDKIKAVRLRNSGSDFRNTMLKDLSITQLAIQANLDLDLTYGEPALVYVNEQFYGLLNIRTEGNTNGIAGLYQAKKSDVTLAKITSLEFIKKDGDFDRIDKFVEAITQQDVIHILEELEVNSFIDYMIFQSYVGNTDWPHNNARFYAIKDGKFRFVLFDLDKVVWLNLGKSPLEVIKGQQSTIISNLFFSLYDNLESFQIAFWNRYQVLLDSGLLTHDQFENIVAKNADQIIAEMPLQIAKYKIPNSMMDWNIELEKLSLLFQEREGIVREYVTSK